MTSSPAEPQGAAHGRRLRGAQGSPLGGYWPLAVAAAVFVAAVVAFPSTTAERVEGPKAEAGTEAETASGWGEQVTPCDGQERQVEDDPYSPPCFAFEGDNGGATSKGVTADEIVVSARVTNDPDVLSVLATLMGIEFTDTGEDIQRTTEVLVEYFNQHFQMYGRKIRLEPFEGKGSLVAELTGGGREAATNDALKAAVEIGAFADITAQTQPYAEALSKQETVNFGAPTMSRKWFTDRRPYAWSFSSDCSVVAEASSEYGLRRLIGKPAVFAGGSMEGKTRKMAVITPTNPEYQQCRTDGLKVVSDAGQEIDLVTDYVLDIARVPNQAKSIAAQLISKGITTISCFCDPLMIMSLTQEMESQGLEPEWVVTGTGYSDLDLIGKGMAKKNDQWLRAFGASPLAEQEVLEESAGYRAFKSIRPDEEPTSIVNVLYYQLYQLAIGIQMAGPTLTPETFETGMFSYPRSTGPAGTWDYALEQYTPVVDVREVWWDPEKISAFDGEAGGYSSTNERYERGDLPDGQPEVFGR